MSRRDDALKYIALYASENLGTPPSTRQVADALGVSQQRACYLMLQLERHGRIEWITRYQYKVIRSEWTPPPDVELA